MIDISHKPTTLRIAVAEAVMQIQSSTLDVIRNNSGPKPDILPTARAAAFLAIKNTASVLPHCHPLPVEGVRVDYEFGEDSLRIEVEAKTIYKTGVEIEAMHGASIAALTIYDMLKPVDKNIEIGTIRLVSKRGGKSDRTAQLDRPLTAEVMVVSDAVVAGEKEDVAGQLVRAGLQRHGLDMGPYQILPDDREEIQSVVREALTRTPDLIVTVGGTGLLPTDITPEAVRPLLDREIPGIMDSARQYGYQRTPKAMVSRGMAGLVGKTLILCLPGSRRGAQESLDALFPALLWIFRE